jgi:chromosome segregation protein
MFLKRLEIQGFKSFANRTVMEFAQGMIAVVGPNGSGKSNVADSLRWVLGEQSAKLIRGKKADDVIFAGSEKKSKMGFCEVVATFDNSDKRIPLDSAEVAIGRRIDRAGNSEYLLNGANVRLLDIIDLVLKSNIGTSRYTVIGQGTIDQMILAGPPEVKNLLDEASGVKTYYIRRDKTLRRLEQTAQNLMRAEDLIAEIAPRLRSLRRQAKKMEERAVVEQELKVYQLEYFGKTFWSLKREIDKLAKAIQTLEEEREQKAIEVKDLQKQAEHEELSKSGAFSQFKAIQAELNVFQSKKNRLLEDLSLIRGKMQSQKQTGVVDASTLKLEEHQLKIKLEEVNKKIALVIEDQEQEKQDFQEATAVLSNLNIQLNKLYELLQNPNTVDWDGFNRELVVLENSVNDFYGKISSGKPWEEVRVSIETFKGIFGNFRNFVGKSFRDPQAGAHLQAELKKVLRDKEDLTAKIQKLELSASKNKITLEFLEKEKQKLHQEQLQLDLELKKSASGSFDEFVKSLILDEAKISQEVESLSQEISQLETLYKTQSSEQEEKQKKLHDLESQLRRAQDGWSQLKDQISSLQIEKAKVDTQAEVLRQEVVGILGELAYESLLAKPVESTTPELEQKLIKLKQQLDSIGGMDELTLKEYQETEARYTLLGEQIEDLKKSMQDLKNILDELDQQIKIKFNQAFEKINEKFEHYFRILFNGGRAYLSLQKSDDKLETDENNETDEKQEATSELRPEEKLVKKYEKSSSNIIGVDIKATPPGKKLASLQALSGGERSLTSIALLCSLLTCFPSPFVVLDEVDAALDDANTIRFAQILSALAHSTQFVTITHNRETMAHANILYGVTMGDDGVSKLLSVKLEQAKQFAK